MKNTWNDLYVLNIKRKTTFWPSYQTEWDLIRSPEPSLVGNILHLAKDLLETGGHVVGLLPAAVIPLQILQEAEEEGVHGHGVNSKERAEMSLI